MELSPIFERFIESSPETVMVRALLEQAFNAESLNTIYEETAERQ